MVLNMQRRDVLATGLAGLAVSALGTNSAIARASDSELAWVPAWRLVEMFRKRELSPLEYARFLLDRIERLDTLGAFISVFPEHLLGEAKRATERKSALPMLHGLPISFKDLTQTSGLRTTFGSLLFNDNMPSQNSVAVEQVISAGGIVFAKTNTPEFGLYPRTINLVAREGVNPWDDTRSCGGSSGGAAIAAATGLGPVAIGTDGGGSIRVPSAFNGVFGMMPSRGLVANLGGLFNSPNSRIGPLTRDVRDAAMLLQVLARFDARDPFSIAYPRSDYVGDLDKGVRGVRIAWSADFGRVVADEPEVVGICRDAARSFRSLGASYSEPPLRLENPGDDFEPDREYSSAKVAQWAREISPNYMDAVSWLATLSGEQAAMLAPYTRSRTRSAEMLALAMQIPPSVRYRVKTGLTELFSRIDLLVSPTIASRAYEFSVYGTKPLRYNEYTMLFNMSGHCGASVPVGFYKGMPVGLQIIGRPGDESLVLRAARALEISRPWAGFRPPGAIQGT